MQEDHRRHGGSAGPSPSPSPSPSSHWGSGSAPPACGPGHWRACRALGQPAEGRRLAPVVSDGPAVPDASARRRSLPLYSPPRRCTLSYSHAKGGRRCGRRDCLLGRRRRRRRRRPQSCCHCRGGAYCCCRVGSHSRGGPDYRRRGGSHSKCRGVPDCRRGGDNSCCCGGHCCRVAALFLSGGQRRQCSCRISSYWPLLLLGHGGVR